jgi:hypothetical protein
MGGLSTLWGQRRNPKATLARVTRFPMLLEQGSDSSRLIILKLDD